MARTRLLALALLGALLPVAAQAEPAYLDDRSTPEALVRSLYNAVNRHEYARAYTYFGPNGGPKPYEIFAQGYADTQFVTVATGTAQSDGAAGSIYYTIPVAIDALSDDGRALVALARSLHPPVGCRLLTTS